MTCRRRGFSLLELVVALVVVLVLMGALFSALSRYQAAAERDMVNINIHTLRTGLRLEVLRRQLAGRTQAVPALTGSNPVRWLDGQLPAYLGEVEAPPGVEARGCWYFDQGQKTLVFRPRAGLFFAPVAGERRWQVVSSGGRDSAVSLVEKQAGP